MLVAGWNTLVSYVIQVAAHAIRRVVSYFAPPGRKTGPGFLNLHYWSIYFIKTKLYMHTKIWWSYVHIRYLVHVQKWTYLALGRPYGWALNFNKSTITNYRKPCHQLHSFSTFKCRRYSINNHLVTADKRTFDNRWPLSSTVDVDRLTVFTYMPWMRLWRWTVYSRVTTSWVTCFFFLPSRGAISANAINSARWNMLQVDHYRWISRHRFVQ